MDFPVFEVHFTNRPGTVVRFLITPSCESERQSFRVLRLLVQRSVPRNTFSLLWPNDGKLLLCDSQLDLNRTVDTVLAARHKVEDPIVVLLAMEIARADIFPLEVKPSHVLLRTPKRLAKRKGYVPGIAKGNPGGTIKTFGEELMNIVASPGIVFPFNVADSQIMAALPHEVFPQSEVKETRLPATGRKSGAQGFPERKCNDFKTASRGNTSYPATAKKTVSGSLTSSSRSGNFKRNISTGKKLHDRKKCRYCGKAFANFANKVRHERIHTGECRCKCRQCGESFTYAYQLINHQLIAHGEAKGGPTQRGDVVIIRRSNPALPKKIKLIFRKSTDMHQFHGVQKVSKKKKAVKRETACPVCGKSFSTPGNANQHVRRFHAENSGDSSRKIATSKLEQTSKTNSSTKKDKFGYDLRKTVERLSMAAALKYSREAIAFGTQKVSCEHCGSEFDTEREMLEHVEGIHADEEIDWESGSGSGGSDGQWRAKISENQQKSHSLPNPSYLWVMLWRLLASPMFCPTVVRWVNRQANEFQIVDKEMLAKVWAVEKGRTAVNLGVLNRAFKNACRCKHLVCVSGTRYVFRFGPNADTTVLAE